MAKIVLNVELQAKNATAELNKLITSIRGIGTELSKIQPNKDLTAQLNALARALNSVSTNVKKVTAAKKDEAQISLKQAQTLKAEAQAREADAKAAQAQAQANKTVTDSVQQQNKSFKDLMTTQIKHQVIQRASAAILNTLAAAWNSVNDTLIQTESMVVSLQRVLQDDVSAERIGDELYAITYEYGAKIEDVNTLAQNFARAGLSWNETLAATEAGVIAMNVAELDATQASETLIAVLTQFDLTAYDLLGTIDKVNKVGDEFPVTSEKILEAIQRVGSAAVNANLDLNDTIGVITALSESTGRAGSSIGTALNSLIQFTKRDSALNVFSQLSDEMAGIVEQYRIGAADILDVWRGLSKEVDDLTQEQSDLLSIYFDSDEGQAVYEELKAELGDISEDVESVYSQFGTYRQNYFISLLKNISTADEAAQTSLNSAGYSIEENAKYMETFEARQNQVMAKWQDMANDEQGLLAVRKWLLDLAEGALDFIDAIGGIGNALQTIIPTLITIKLLFNFNKTQATMEGLLKGIHSIVDGLKSLPTLLSTIKAGFNAMGTAANGAAAASNAATTAANAASAAMAAATLGVSLIITAISWIVNAVQAANQKAEEARQAAIETGLAAKDEVENLLTLRDSMREAEVGTEEFTAASQALAEALGLSADSFEKSGLSAEEYAEKLEKLTEAQLQQALVDAALGVEAANKGIAPEEKEKYKQYLQDIERLSQIYANAKLNGDEIAAENSLEEYEKIKEQVESDWGQEIAKAIEAEESYQQIYDILNGVNNSAEDTADATNSWATALEGVKTQFSDILNDTEEVNEELSYQNKVLEAQKALTEAIAQARKDYLNSMLDEYLDGLEDETKYEEYLLKIEEERRDLVIERVQAYIDGLEEETTLQERLLAVEEAREALENAKNQRTVRVFNAETGNWEWQADRHEVEDAQNNLDEAEASLDEYLKSQAWQEIQNAIKDGSANESTISQILDKWLSLSGSGELNSWGDGLVREINDATKDAADATTSSVDSLTEYLKNEAVAEIRELIDSGNATSGGIKDILDKYLQKSGDGALFEWADNLNTAMSKAIESGYFDGSKVTTQVQALNTAQENLQAYLAMKVIDNIMEAAGDGKPTQEMIDNAIKNSGLSPSMQSEVRKLVTNALSNVPESQPETGTHERGDLAWVPTKEQMDKNPWNLGRYKNQDELAFNIETLYEQLYNAPYNDPYYEAIPGFFDAVLSSLKLQFSDGTSRNLLVTQEEFAEKDWAENYANYQDYVEQSLNKYIDNSLGLNKETREHLKYILDTLLENSDILTYQPGTYDNGGILYGMGGIKATGNAEAVLGPELTKKMLEPITTAQFREAVENLGFIFAHPREMVTATDVLKDITFLNRGGPTTQNNGPQYQYTINGMQISKEVAENYTVAELLSSAAFLSGSNF